MACLPALFAVAFLMIHAGELAYAAPMSPAEEFWRTAMPDTPIPHVIHELLHHDTSITNEDKANDPEPTPPAPPSPVHFSYEDYRAMTRKSTSGSRNPDPAPSTFDCDYANTAGKNMNHISPRKAGTDNVVGEEDPPSPFEYDYKGSGQRLGNGAREPSLFGPKHLGNINARETTVFFLEEAVRVGKRLALDIQQAAAPLQLYTVRAVRAIEGSSFVVCRGGAYPNAAYGCHTTGPARVHMIDMAGEGGGTVTAVTLCQTDTSRWNPEHVALQLLDVKPGGAPICHVIPHGEILWAKHENSSA